jgi:hypothetical protein
LIWAVQADDSSSEAGLPASHDKALSFVCALSPS